MPYTAASLPRVVSLEARNSAPQVLQSHRWFHVLLGCTMALGSAVLIEPAPIDLAIVAVLGLAVLAGVLHLHSVHRAPMVLGALFLIANLLSLPNCVDLQRGIWYFAVTAYLVLSILLFTGVTTACGKTIMTAMFKGYVFAGLVSAILGIAAYFDLVPYRNLLLLNGRVKGLFKDPNVYGPYLVPILVYSLLMMQDRICTSVKAVWGSVALLSVAGVFLSFSRACWLNCVVSAGLALALTALQSASLLELMRKIIAVAVILAVIGGLIAITATIPEVRSMLSIRLGQSGLQNYDQMRFQTHSRAIEAAMQEPLGIGPGQSEIVFQYAVHSLYLRVFTENGWLGLISFFGLVLATAWRAIRVSFLLQDPYWRRLFTVAGACIVGLLANSIVIDSVHWRHFYFLLGVAWAVPVEMRITRRTITNGPLNTPRVDVYKRTRLTGDAFGGFNS